MLPNLSEKKIWLITGSQHLYGSEVLKQVEQHSREIANFLDRSVRISVKVVYKPIVKSSEEIYAIIQQANMSKDCIGILCWMHTFSPGKMWIRGLKALQKPLLHLHTQFNRDLPYSEIDMDFMNLNQSAHGDREFGHICTRLKIRRKVVVGHWKHENILNQIDSWARACAAWEDWQGAKFVRFGDNMRQVSVTEGDKVEAEIRFGYSVNTFGISELVASINKVTPKQIDQLCKEYEEQYALCDNLKKNGKKHVALCEAAKIELGLRHFLEEGNFKGFTDTFEDLHGLNQLPGIAVQRLMREGYGFGAEGDWKTAALLRAMKVMSAGLPGGNSFMEDYTYHLEQGEELVLGAHMLEICETIAGEKPRCEIHPLGIGGKSDPVRLVFDVRGGAALNASLIDLGDKFRLLVNAIQAVKPIHAFPNLPVARVLWKPLPNFEIATEAWLLAGGAHHTVYSQNLTSQHLQDFAEIAGLECITIDESTKLSTLKTQLK